MKRRSKYFPTKAAAERWLDNQRARKTEGRLLPWLGALALIAILIAMMAST